MTIPDEMAEIAKELTYPEGNPVNLHHECVSSQFPVTTIISDILKEESVVIGEKGLESCQIQTPLEVIEFIWNLLNKHRKSIGTVVDYGAGDGRFSMRGSYEEYLGIEIDPTKRPISNMPSNADLVYGCILDNKDKFDTCIGNPPYVRNHDINRSWRMRAINLIKREIGSVVNELCN